MWFTSWSGKTSVWTILHTHAAALLHTYTEKKNQCAHPHRRTSKMTTLPYTCCTPCCYSCSLEKNTVAAACQEDSGFLFWIIARADADPYYTLTPYVHTHVRLHRPTYTQAYKQKATKTNSGLHFSLQLEGIPSVNMTWGMTEWEVGNAVSHAELSLTPFTLMWTQTRPLPVDMTQVKGSCFPQT